MQSLQKSNKLKSNKKIYMSNLNTIKATLSSIYSKMSSEGSVHNFPNNTKLLRSALLSLPSIKGPKVVSPPWIFLFHLSIHLLIATINWHIHMHIQKQCSMHNFSVMFFVGIFYIFVFLEPHSLTYIYEILFVFSWYIYIDYSGLKHFCVLSWCAVYRM